MDVRYCARVVGGMSAYVMLGNEMSTSALHHCEGLNHKPHNSAHVIAIIDLEF
jgi:hypothetical protein